MQAIVIFKFQSQPLLNEGVYVGEISDDRDQIGGNGASRPDIQRIGEMMGLFKIVVLSKSILDEEQAALLNSDKLAA